MAARASLTSWTMGSMVMVSRAKVQVYKYLGSCRGFEGCGLVANHEIRGRRPQLQKNRIRNDDPGGAAATVAGDVGPGFHNSPLGYTPQDTDSKSLIRIIKKRSEKRSAPRPGSATPATVAALPTGWTFWTGFRATESRYLGRDQTMHSFVHHWRARHIRWGRAPRGRLG